MIPCIMTKLAACIVSVISAFVLSACANHGSPFSSSAVQNSSALSVQSSLGGDTEQSSSSPYAVVSPPSLHSPDISLVYPNGGEHISLKSAVSLRYKISDTLRKKMSSVMLTELYLLRPDGVIEGYIGNIDHPSNTSFVWHPDQVIHWGGLDTTVQIPPPGQYRILLLVREKRPGNGIEDPVDILVDGFDKFDGEGILTPDTRYGNVDHAKPFVTPLIASDVSDAPFILTAN